MVKKAGWTRADLLSHFRTLLDRMETIVGEKNADYADNNDPFANFREFGELGFLVRMSDKWKRIRNLLKPEATKPIVKDETVEDTLLDLAIYCLLLLCWREAGK